MTYITSTFTIIITLCVPVSLGYLNFARTKVVGYTRNITIKQGLLQGEVVKFLDNNNLPEVEQYKGIAYAAAPVGGLRFMPSGSAPSWFGTKFADEFGPVCPQNFPDIRNMAENRLEKFLNLRDQLQNQSEDCLYLNIYAPHQKGSLRNSRKFPVMVYIHGESYEWNSGNPYDGSVLAAYGKVIVVTLNYRVGVLGFLKADTDDASKSNFGLVDQIAALVWVKANIAAFAGDPNAVTIFGHGTGAVCVNLLMLSPMALQNDQELFRRAILMGGSALSDWALVSNPLEVSYQVAQAVNCPIHHNFSTCLGRKRLDELLSASVVTAPYKTKFGPVVDGLKVPNDPGKLMTTYSDIFRRFELMYGVTEIESINLLGARALQNGIMEKERDQELRKYFRYRCEMKPEACLTETLAEYADAEFMLDDEKYGDYEGHEPDRASLARDVLLDILSDARTVAPMVQMGQYHAAFDQRSYFYVFTHKTQGTKEFPRHKSSTGEELPFVFGVPLGDTTSRYSEEERLFSEVMMTYFCNFALTGNPKVPRKDRYISPNFTDWIKYMIDWPEFDLENQQYLQLGIPPYIRNNYRERKMKFWNEAFPKISSNTSSNQNPRTDPIHNLKNTLSWPPVFTQPKGTAFNRYENFIKPESRPLPSSFREAVYGDVKLTATTPPDNMMNNNEHNVVYGTVINSPPNEIKAGVSTTIIIAIGSIFLLCNILCLFLSIYYRRYKKKKRLNAVQKVEEPAVNSEEANKETKVDMANGCNIMKMVSKSSRSDDTYEAVKSNGSARKKMPRQMSNSTIDAHTKVRDWITNEIVYKYSPRFLRRHRQELKIFDGGKNEAAPSNDNRDNDTLGRSPTRPVSPEGASRPPLLKSSSIPVQKTRSKPEKVSVGIDATPSGRGFSVLQQQPIELTKSLDRAYFDTPLRRSLTLEDFSSIKAEDKQELRKSTTSINLQLSETPTIVRIEHSHSKSDPVQEIYACSKLKKLKTFDPYCDVNVTSLDENIGAATPLTPEESLMTIKRRNFPKVLPDYPSREAFAKKRRSMPVANHLFMAIPEIPPHSQPNSPTNKVFGKLPPAPPQRTTSTLSRKHNYQTQTSCQSAPMLAQEPPRSPEPEVTCNNLYFGPLIPKLQKNELSSSDSCKLNTQPVYESLRIINETDTRNNDKSQPKTVITADRNHPVRKTEPKVIIKPTMIRSMSDPKKNIPRVLAPEGVGVQEEGEKVADKETKPMKSSQIPLLVKTSKESSSSESTSSPSEESDTGTVVKKI